MDDASTARPLVDLFGNRVAQFSKGKSTRATSERSELVRYFFENAEKSWTGKMPLKPAYVGFKLAHLSVRDLYAFRSMCEDRKRTGYPWAKFFWGALKNQEWEKAGNAS